MVNKDVYTYKPIGHGLKYEHKISIAPDNVSLVFCLQSLPKNSKIKSGSGAFSCYSSLAIYTIANRPKI